MLIIFLGIMAGMLGYLIVPDKSPNANQQNLEIAARKPGFRVNMMKQRKNEEIIRKGLAGRMLFGQRSLYTFIPFASYEFSGDSIVCRVVGGIGAGSCDV